MSFDINKPSWPDGDPRFDIIGEIMRSANARLLFDLLEEYKRIAILELPDAVKGTDTKLALLLTARIDFIDEIVSLLRQTTEPKEEENDDGE